MTSRKLPHHIRILINTLIVFLLFLPAALRDGRILGARTSGSEKIPHSGPPGGDELKSAGYADTVLQECGRGSWHIITAAGKRVGTVISTAAHDRTAGYAGPIPMRIYLDAAESVRKILILPNDKTPSFMQKITAGRFLDSWLGQKAAKAASRRHDAVSGASMSCRAINAGLEKSLSAYLAVRNIRITSGYTPAGDLKTVAVLAVLFLALILSLFPRRHHHFRAVILILNTGVIGFWAGQFLSLSGMFGWLKQGDAPLVGLAFLAGAGILLPLLGRSNFYCTWICPYGALQELAGRIPVRKIKLSGTSLRRLGRLRDVILAVLLILLWAGAGSAVLQYEPFSAFLIQQAALPVLILAVLFLILSLFIHRPWCRFCCPTGALLNRFSGNQRL